MATMVKAKAKGIISSREQQKKFDQAVKDVIKQRKAANKFQNAVRQAQKQGQPQNGRASVGPGVSPGGSGSDQNAKLAALISNSRSTHFADMRGHNRSTSDSSQNSRQRAQRRGSAHDVNLSSTGVGGTAGITGSYSTEGLSRLRQENPRDVPQHPRNASIQLGGNWVGAAGMSPSVAHVQAPGGGAGSRRRMTIDEHARRRPATFLVPENRRGSDGDSPMNVNEYAEPRRRLIEEGDVAVLPSQRKITGVRRSSWNRSSSFKSSLNQGQMQAILNGDDLDNKKLGEGNNDEDGEPQDLGMRRVTSTGSLTMSGIGRGSRMSDLARSLTSGGGGGTLGLGSDAYEAHGDTLLMPTYRPSGNKKSGENGSEEGIEAVSVGSNDQDLGDLAKKAPLVTSPSTGPVAGRQSRPGLEMELGSRKGSQRSILDMPRVSSGHRLEQQRNSLQSSGSVILDKDAVNGLDRIKEHDGRRSSIESESARGSNKSNDDWAWLEEATSEKKKEDETRMEKERAETKKKIEQKKGADVAVANGLGNIKLEDLIPTKRTFSREGSERSMGNKSGGGSVKSGGSSPHKEMINSWKKQELKLFPPQVDFNLGASETDRDVGLEEGGDMGTEAFFDAMPSVKNSFKAGELSDAAKANLGEGRRGAQVSVGSRTISSSDLSFATAKETLDISSDKPNGNQDNDVCPRSQFALISQQKSQSGATGQTHGTSASSLISDGSLVNPAAENPLNVNNRNSPTFEVIREESRDIGDTDRSRSERASGDKLEMRAAAENVRAYTTYKDHKKSKIKRIRKGIRKTLMGSKNSSASQQQSEYGEMCSQEGESTISADQKERLANHLTRKSSSHSITSAISSFSAISKSERSTSSNKSSRWVRFMGKKGRAQSLHDINASLGRSQGSSSRSIQLPGNRRDSTSNRSNLSSRSNLSNTSQDSPFRGRFTDFYDHNDHAQAVSTLISSKSASGRSLVTPLATVREPSAGEGEMKHDEDYHLARQQQQQNNSLHNISDKTSISPRNSLDKELSAYQSYMNNSMRSDDSMNSYYRHPSHDHLLVHMRPNQLFPDSPGWQCDECYQETFDLNVWAYISTEKNYLLCESCFTKSGFSVEG